MEKKSYLDLDSVEPERKTRIFQNHFWKNSPLDIWRGKASKADLPPPIDPWKAEYYQKHPALGINPHLKTFVENLRPNEEVLNELEPSVADLDEDANLPEWMKVFDKKRDLIYPRIPKTLLAFYLQKTRGKLESILTKCGISVKTQPVTIDETIQEIETEQKQKKEELKIMKLIDDFYFDVIREGHDTLHLIDNELLTWAKELILLIKRRRELEGLKPYTDDEIMMITGKVWDSDHLHTKFKNIRGSGEPYARTHLRKATEYAVKEAGMTEVEDVLEMLCHDDIEDLPIHHDLDHPDHDKKKPKLRPRKELLLGDYIYNDKLSDASKKRIPKVREEVYRGTLALTKIKEEGQSKKEEEERNFQRFMGAVLKYGIRALVRRCCERSHNTDTIDTLPKPFERKEEIALTTAHVHAQIAKYFNAHRVFEHLLKGCFNFLNPGARDRFNKILTERIDSLFQAKDNQQSSFYQTLFKLGIENHHLIEKVTIRPDNFEKYVDQNRISDQTYTPEIDEANPLCKMVIIASQIENYKDIRQKIYGKFNPEELTCEEDQFGRKWIKMNKPDLSHEKDIIFLITTKKLEALRAHGEIPLKREQKNPQSIIYPIRRILKKTKASPHGILKVAEIEFGKPVTAKTRMHDSKRLHPDASGLDFASAVGVKVFEGATGINRYEEIGQAPKILSIFEALGPGGEYKRGEQPYRKEEHERGKYKVQTGSEFQIEPQWINCVVSPEALQMIKDRLAKRHRDELLRIGNEYIEDISSLCGLSSKTVFLTEVGKKLEEQTKELQQALNTKTREHEALKKGLNDASTSSQEKRDLEKELAKINKEIRTLTDMQQSEKTKNRKGFARLSEEDKILTITMNKINLSEILSRIEEFNLTGDETLPALQKPRRCAELGTKYLKQLQGFFEYADTSEIILSLKEFIGREHQTTLQKLHATSQKLKGEIQKLRNTLGAGNPEEWEEYQYILQEIKQFLEEIKKTLGHLKEEPNIATQISSIGSIEDKLLKPLCKALTPQTTVEYLMDIHTYGTGKANDGQQIKIESTQHELEILLDELKDIKEEYDEQKEKRAFLHAGYDEAVLSIGLAKINPLEILAEDEQFKNGVHIIMSAPNKPGVFEEVSKQCWKDGHNIDKFKQVEAGEEKDDGEESKLDFEIYPKLPFIDVYDIFKTILRLSYYGYTETKIEPVEPKKKLLGKLRKALQRNFLL